MELDQRSSTSAADSFSIIITVLFSGAPVGDVDDWLLLLVSLLEGGASGGRKTVNSSLEVTEPSGVTTVMGPLVAPSGTVATTHALNRARTDKVWDKVRDKVDGGVLTNAALRTGGLK